MFKDISQINDQFKKFFQQVEGLDKEKRIARWVVFLILAQAVTVYWFVVGPSEPPLWQFLLSWLGHDWWASYTLLWLIDILILIGIKSLYDHSRALFGTNWDVKSSDAKLVLIFFLFAAVANHGLYYIVEIETTRTHLEKVIERGQIAIKNNQMQLGIRLLQDAQAAMENGDPRMPEVMLSLSTGYLKAKQYSASIDSACWYLPAVNNSAADKAKQSIARANVRASTYAIAHTRTVTQTLNQISEVRRKYDDLCVEPTSVFWMAISPEVIDCMEYNPFLRERPSCNLLQSDLDTLDWLVKHYPSEPSLDIALYILGDYREIILRHQKSSIIDHAYYAWGLQAFAAGDYQEAIRRFKAFTSAFPDHRWHDDALWRIAKGYAGLGDYRNALSYWFNALNDQHGDKKLADVCTVCDFAYLFDVLPEVDLVGLASLTTQPKFAAILEYAQADRMLVNGRYLEARGLFEQVRAKYPDVQIVLDETTTISLTQKTKSRAEDIGKLLNLLTDTSPVTRRRKEAEFLQHNPDFLMALWDLGAKSLRPRELPPELFLARATQYRAAKLLEESITLSVQGRLPFEDELSIRKQIAQAYRWTAEDRALNDRKTIEALRKSAIDQYRYVLARLPPGSKEFDNLFEAVGSIYLGRPDLDQSSWLKILSLDDVRGLRQEYDRLAQEYPAHRLANNALNWVAWSYCWEANYYLKEPQKYEANYRKALEYYMRIRDKYPSKTLTWTNAVDNIAMIQRKLQDPTLRVPLPEKQWEWYREGSK